MRRFLFQLSLLAGLAALVVSDRANSQPGSDGGGFGVLQLKPQPPAAAPSTGGLTTAAAAAPLPSGVVPAAAKTGPVAKAPPAPPPPRPANPFPLPPNLGDWLICAATYVGPDGFDLARQVTLELRNRHRVPAYI